MILVLFCLFQGPSWSIDDLGIYQPINAHEVAVDTENALYIPDKAENRVIRVGPEGTLSTLGREGRGPGELSRIGALYHDGSHLFVKNIFPSFIHVFQGEDHQTTVTPPFGTESLIPLAGGWLFVARSATESRRELCLSDRELGERRVLKTWPTSSREAAEVGRGNVIALDPTEPKILLVLSTSGRQAFFARPREPTLYRIDGDGTLTEVLTLEHHYPFDADWGRARVREAEARINLDSPIRFTLKPILPDYFPWFQRIDAGPGNLLWIRDGRHYHEPSAQPLVIDASGREATGPIAGLDVARVIHVDGDYAWVTRFNRQDGVAGVARIPLRTVATYTRDNPIETD